MKEQLLRYIKQEHLFDPKDKILLTVSGGIDSVVMCHLFHSAGLQFAIAHCNFQLRDDKAMKMNNLLSNLLQHLKPHFTTSGLTRKIT